MSVTLLTGELTSSVVTRTIFVNLQDSVSDLPTGPQPPFFQKLLNMMLPAAVDRKPKNSSFGDVVQQVYPLYRQVGPAASLRV